MKKNLILPKYKNTVYMNIQKLQWNKKKVLKANKLSGYYDSQKEGFHDLVKKFTI